MVLESQVADVLEDVGGVLAAEDRVEEDPVHLARRSAARASTSRGSDGSTRVGHGEVQREPELEGGVAGAQRLHGPAVAEHEVVRGGETVGGRLRPGACMPAV